MVKRKRIAGRQMGRKGRTRLLFDCFMHAISPREVLGEQKYQQQQVERCMSIPLSIYFFPWTEWSCCWTDWAEIRPNSNPTPQLDPILKYHVMVFASLLNCMPIIVVSRVTLIPNEPFFWSQAHIIIINYSDVAQSHHLLGLLLARQDPIGSIRFENPLQ